MDREIKKLKRLTAQMTGWRQWKEYREAVEYWTLEQHLECLKQLNNKLNQISAGQSTQEMPEVEENSGYDDSDNLG